MKCAAQIVPNLTGVDDASVEEELFAVGFEWHHRTPGGYNEWRHEDGSKIWIRPTGAVVRLGPKVTSADGRRYRPRFDQYGNQTQLHSTGEVIG